MTFCLDAKIIKPVGENINNAVVLLDANNNPIGNRVLGPVTDKLKKSGFGKIINMSSLSAF